VRDHRRQRAAPRRRRQQPTPNCVNENCFSPGDGSRTVTILVSAAARLPWWVMHASSPPKSGASSLPGPGACGGPTPSSCKGDESSPTTIHVADLYAGRETHICVHGPGPVFGSACRYLLMVVGAPHSSAEAQEAQIVLGGMSRTRRSQRSQVFGTL
jgi:hypothetical protein